MIYVGWSFSNLGTAADDIKDRVAKLKPSPNRCCVCCGCCLSAPTLRTYDAGQAYEALSPSK
eukprot:2377835-Karenia_brevis.AAC.1